MSIEGRYIDGEMVKIAKDCDFPQLDDTTGEEFSCGEQASFMYKFNDGNIWYLCEDCAKKMARLIPPADLLMGDTPLNES